MDFSLKLINDPPNLNFSLAICSKLIPVNLLFCCEKKELLSVEISIGMLEFFKDSFKI